MPNVPPNLELRKCSAKISPVEFDPLHASLTARKLVDGLPQEAREESLRAWLLLLLAVERKQRDARDLHDLESHTRDITDSMALAAKARNQHLILHD